MGKFLIKLLFICLFVAASISCEGKIKSNLLNKSEIIKIATKKMKEVYGEKVLENVPFSAEKKGEEWVVRGALKCPGEAKTCLGGMPEVTLSLDGKIKKYTHGK